LRREAPSQADFDREEETARAAYSACAARSVASRSAAGAGEAEATQAAYFRAVERAMEYCRPQAELASHYFDETARAVYIDAKDTCRALHKERIEANVVAVIDGGTRLLIYAAAGDRGHPQPGRDR